MNFEFSYVIVGLLLFACSFTISLILIWLLRKYAFAIGLVDHPGDRKIHVRTTPVGGGVAIFWATAIVLIGYLVFTTQIHQLLKLQKFVVAKSDLLVILAGGFTIFLTGLIDDYKNLGPWTKLLVQIAVGAWLFFHDIRVTLFISNQIFSLIVSISWIVVITNAFNLLDNMDGLSSGVAFISGLIFLSVAVTVGQWSLAFCLLALLGGILGFWCYNFPPASIFMGDSGSLFIGYMLSTLSIYATFYQKEFPLFSVALPLLVFAIPLFDTTTVVLHRWKNKKPIFQGDKNHFSHRLVSLGMSKKTAVLFIYLVTFASGITALLLYQIDSLGALVIVVQLFCFLLIIHFLEQTARNSK